MHTLIHGKDSMGKTTIARALQTFYASRSTCVRIVDDIRPTCRGPRASLTGSEKESPASDGFPIYITRSYRRKNDQPTIFVSETDITLKLAERGIKITRTIHVS